MGRKIKIRRSTRVYLDEELEEVPQRDEEGKPLFEPRLNEDKTPMMSGDGETPLFTDKPLMKEEMVTKVRVIGKEWPEPEEGTIFHLGLMRISDAMKFTSISRDKRAEAMDQYAPKAIKGWERMLDEDESDLGFDKDLIEYIPTLDRLFLVMEAVNQSMGEKARGKG